MFGWMVVIKITVDKSDHMKGFLPQKWPGHLVGWSAGTWGYWLLILQEC